MTSSSRKSKLRRLRKSIRIVSGTNSPQMGKLHICSNAGEGNEKILSFVSAPPQIQLIQTCYAYSSKLCINKNNFSPFKEKASFLRSIRGSVKYGERTKCRYSVLYPHLCAGRNRDRNRLQ